MTKQAIIGQLLMTGLFKLADEIQHTLEKIQLRYPAAINQIKELELEVEEKIDYMLVNFRDDPLSISMEDIDRIHSNIIKIRGLIE